MWTRDPSGTLQKRKTGTEDPRKTGKPGPSNPVGIFRDPTKPGKQGPGTFIFTHFISILLNNSSGTKYWSN